MSAAKPSKKHPLRIRQLAAIHASAKKIGMDEETYRDMLARVANVRSAADLDAAGRSRVLKELARLTGSQVRRNRQAVPPPADAPKLREELAAMGTKIEAILTELDLTWAYANGMAKKMFHVARVEWLRADQMRKLIAALTYHQKRVRAKEKTNGN